MNEPPIDATPNETSANPQSDFSLRQSLNRENIVYSQSMPMNYGRNFKQPQRQNDCRPQQNDCKPQQNDCRPQQNDCRPQPPPPCQTPAPSPVCRPARVAYQAAMPYPLVNPQCKNPQYAAAILDNIGGQNSEMSAIGFYLYHSTITSEYKELAETFYHINLVEMHHMELFGSLAVQLGENPRLWSRKGRGGQYMYWSPAYIKYSQFPIPPSKNDDCGCISNPAPNPALKAMLAQAIEGEEGAVKKYMQQTTWIQDVNVCDILRRIAADEQMHIEILTRLFHKY